jgi:hypothetical protein
LIAAGLGVTIAPACVSTLALSNVAFRPLRSSHRTSVESASVEISRRRLQELS